MVSVSTTPFFVVELSLFVFMLMYNQGVFDVIEINVVPAAVILGPVLVVKIGILSCIRTTAYFFTVDLDGFRLSSEWLVGFADFPSSPPHVFHTGMKMQI